MSASNTVLKWAITRTITRSLTGNPKDLKKLISLSRRIPTTIAMTRFFNSLDYAVDHGENWAEMFLRLGRELSPAYRRKIVSNLIYNQYIKGQKQRRARCTDGNMVPSLIVISPTMRCNLSCTGCYSGLYQKEEVLPYEEMDRIIGEARELGIYFAVISGGEPYLLKDQLLSLFEKYDDMFFLTYTNGTLLDEDTCRALARLGNVAPGISVEGFESETEARRGKGVFEKIVRAMDTLKREGVFFGFSATATSRNIDVITSEEFARFYIDRGALFGWYFIFLPVGKDPVLELAPTPEQRVEMGKRVARLRDTHPIFLGDFWNDGPAVGGCLAGGKYYLHILNNGNVEPCVFAHFSSDNIKGKSLFEVANSPFFKAIRREFPFNETGNLKRPCMIIDNPQVLRKLVDQYVIPAGHQNADAIIHDPRVAEWADRYSKRMEELTEADWEKMINDPENRWYKDGPEYREYLHPPVMNRPAGSRHP